MDAPRVRCPTCQREVAWTADSKWRPFCSERCRMVDLGAWFAGERAIPGDTPDATHAAAESPDPAD